MRSPAAFGGGLPAGLGRASLGIVPNLWNNADVPDLGSGVPTAAVVAEVARLGYAGIQLSSSGELRGRALREVCRSAGLRIAESYASLACSTSGPPEGSLDACRRELEELVSADGDVLVLACALAPGRVERAARVDSSTSRLTRDGWTRLVHDVDLLARETLARGKRLSFHNHVGTFVETAEELDHLAALTDERVVGLCLDVGHYTLAGGDPTTALRTFGSRIDHVHLKDVSPQVRQGMRDGSIDGFIAGLRARVFTELGGGAIDLEGVLRLLAARGYGGWLMVEQDTTWRPPAESAAISHAVLRQTLLRLADEAG